MADDNMKTLTYLTKFLFIRGLQCHKSLYLHKYQPELKDELSGSQEALFETGYEVGALAKDLFPGGVEIPYEGLTAREQLERTREEIGKGTATLYEAAFSHDDVFIKADILHKDVEGWNLYEVKASTEQKDVHLDDVAVQYHVLKGAGLPVARTHLVHINSGYVRQGDIEVHKLFTVKDITGEVLRKQDFVVQEILKMREMLTGPTPAIDIGKQCSEPYGCDFRGHCWVHIPENSVFDLRGKWSDRFALYRKGIVRLEDVPLDMLDRDQMMQVEAFVRQKEFVDKKAVERFLGSLRYPLYFLDFETFMPAIPIFDGVRPYQKFPFQYSIHYLTKENDEVGHHEFLVQPNADPRKDLLTKLLAEIPPDACVLAYHASFESDILKDLAGWFPKYAPQVQTILGNMVDLAVPFRDRYVYHWKMRGSWSQKVVLPVLVPGLTYEGMEIGDGGMAMDAYARMGAADDPAEIQRIRKALLDYCGLDTLGMVKIVEVLRGMVQ